MEDNEDGGLGDLFGEGGERWSDLGAEQALLGKLLAKPGEVAGVVSLVGHTDFFDRWHQVIFQLFETSAEDGFPVDREAIIARIGGPAIPMLDGSPLEQYVGRLAAAGFENEAGAQDLAEYIQGIAEVRAYGSEPPADLTVGAFKSSMGLVMWSDQNDPTGGQYEYIVEDLIPKGQGVVISGASGVGKSFLGFKLGMSIARGVDFFGRGTLKKMGVVWLAYEAGAGAPARMRAYRRFHDLQVDDTPFAMLTRPLHLWEKQRATPENAPARKRAVEQIIEEIRQVHRNRMPEHELGVVFIDTYNAATPGASEIDSEVVSTIREDFHKIMKELGCTLIIIGHTNDQGKNRGNQQLTNNFDTFIRIERKTTTIRIDGNREEVAIKDKQHREIRTMRLVKQREGIDSASHDFVLHIVEDGTKNSFGKARTTCVVVEPDKTAEMESKERTPHGMQDIKQPKQKALFATLVSALRLHGQSMPNDVRAPPGTVGVRWSDWMQEAIRKLVEDEGGDVAELMTKTGKGTPHQRAKDAIAQVRPRWDGKLIGNDAGWYWRTKVLIAGIDEKPQRRDVSADLPDFDFDPNDFPPN